MINKKTFVECYFKQIQILWILFKERFDSLDCLLEEFSFWESLIYLLCLAFQQSFYQLMYGQPPGYGAPGYGAPGYGAPGYGAPGYGAPGYGAPGYGAPPPRGGPTVIQIKNDDNDGTPCQFCGTNTNHITRRKIGCVTIAWSLCLLGTGVLWCIPCFVDGCKDVELVCIKCQNVKGTIEATCC